jgi:hypothetical protein
VLIIVSVYRYVVVPGIKLIVRDVSDQRHRRLHLVSVRHSGKCVWLDRSTDCLTAILRFSRQPCEYTTGRQFRVYDNADIRSGEITDETNEARAFSLFPICLNSGIIVASYLGGTFANTRGTSIGNAIPLFDKYPYALPMILSSLFPLVSGLTALFFLKETLPQNLHAESEQASPEDKSLKKLMTRHISLIIFSFGVLSLLGIGIGALLPLFCFTPIEHGGLGFNAKTIGSVISQRSVSVLIIQMVAFPWFQKRVGTTRLFKWLMTLWIPTMLLMPLCNIFARMGNETMLWISLYLFMLVGSLAGMAFGKSLLYIPAYTLLMTSLQLAHDQQSGTITPASRSHQRLCPSHFLSGGYHWSRWLYIAFRSQCR